MSSVGEIFSRSASVGSSAHSLSAEEIDSAVLEDARAVLFDNRRESFCTVHRREGKKWQAAMRAGPGGAKPRLEAGKVVVPGALVLPSVSETV